MRCSKLKNKIRSCQENVSEKSLLISQLEEAIKHLGKVKIYPCQNLSVIKSQNLSAYNILYIKLFLIRTNMNFIFTKKQEIKLIVLMKKMKEKVKISKKFKENSLIITNLWLN